MEEKHDGCCKSYFPLHAPNWPSFLPKKRNQMLLPVQSKKAKHKYQKRLYGKSQSMFLKEMNMFPVRKNKKGLTWPCML